MNSILSWVAAVPGFAAKQVEDTKFKANLTSTHPISAAYGGRHTFVPLAMEDGGRIGSNGYAVLMMLAEHAVAKGKLPPGLGTRHAPLPGGGILAGPQVAATAIHVAPKDMPKRYMLKRYAVRCNIVKSDNQKRISHEHDPYRTIPYGTVWYCTGGTLLILGARRRRSHKAFIRGASRRSLSYPSSAAPRRSRVCTARYRTVRYRTVR